MCLADEVLDDVEVTIITSIVKWCTTVNVHTRWVTVCLTDEVLDDVEVTIITSIVKWCTTVNVLTRWVTVCLTDEVLDDIEVTITTSIVKRRITIIVLARSGVTVCLTDEVLDDVEVTISTGEVKWCTFVLVLDGWIAAPYSNEVFHQIQVAIIGGVVHRNESLAVSDSMAMTGNETLGKLLPAPVSSKMKQRDLSYLFVIQK